MEVLNGEMEECKISSTETSKIEFDVNLNCGKCTTKVHAALSGLSEVKDINIDLEKQSVLVETSLPSQIIKEAIESTGKRAVLKGYGINKLGSAVAEIKSASGIFGVVRFHQKNEDLCIIDGTIDGLQPGEHGLHIHEYGDLSDEFERLGPHFDPFDVMKHGGPKDKERHYGDLGNISAGDSGRASFWKEDSVVKVWDIIGRSLAVTSDKDDLGKGTNHKSKIDGNSGDILACAIIARSAGMFENPKRVCQCDGISIWDERNYPASTL